MRTQTNFKPAYNYYQAKKRQNLSEISSGTPGKIFFRRLLTALKMVLLYSFILLVFYLCYYFIFVSGFFHITELEVTGAEKFISASDVKNISIQHALGKNILTYNSSELEKTLMANFIGIKDLKISKSYFHKLKLRVEERVPIVIVKSKEEFFLIDADGFVLGMYDIDAGVKGEYNNLPVINYEDEVRVGSFINKDILPAYIELYSVMSDKNIKASSMSFTNEYVQIYIDDGVLVLIGASKKKKESLYLISDLLKQLKIEGKNVKKIDLRYDKVIVEYLDSKQVD